jgi:TPR repeat protein
LGGIYENGRGVPRNYATAAYWYHKAAAQGNAAARRGLRRLHRQVSR